MSESQNELIGPWMWRVNSGHLIAEELVKVLRLLQLWREHISLLCAAILHGLLDGLQKETNSPATDSPIMQQFIQQVVAAIMQQWELDLPDLTSSWVVAQGVDRSLNFLDQAAIETVKSDLVNCTGAFLLLTHQLLGPLKMNHLRRDRSALHSIFCC